MMHKGAFDLSVKDHKAYKAVPQRENLTIAEHGVLIFTETIGISLHRKNDTQGFSELQRDAHEAGKAGKVHERLQRQHLESQSYHQKAICI